MICFNKDIIILCVRVSSKFSKEAHLEMEKLEMIKIKKKYTNSFRRCILFCFFALILLGSLFDFSNSIAFGANGTSIEEEKSTSDANSQSLFFNSVLFIEKPKDSIIYPLYPKKYIGSDIISFLTTEEQAQARLVSRSFRDCTDLMFFGSTNDPAFSVHAFSSEISGGTIGSNIFNILRTAQHRIIIASDKCTNEEFLDDLLTLRSLSGSPLDISIVTGEDNKTQEILTASKYSSLSYHHVLKKADGSGKMHNKFIIMDDYLVITGSPNLTYAAYNYNVESFVAIHHKFVANIYFSYFEYIISGKDKYDHTQEEYKKVRKLMNIFNNISNSPIQICLAPILDIKTFVIGELSSTQLIDINMFLVSRAKREEGDIVDTLLKAIEDGTRVTIKVDKNQYHTMRYMQKALQPIREAAQTIYTVSKTSERWSTRTSVIDKTRPQFHDKLVLIRQRDNVKKAFIGSAGFTDNVQDNLNLENMVLFKIDGIYDFLMDHFNSIYDSRGNLSVNQI